MHGCCTQCQRASTNHTAPKDFCEHKTKGVSSYSLVITEIIGATIKMRAKASNKISHMSLEKFDSM